MGRKFWADENEMAGARYPERTARELRDRWTYLRHRSKRHAASSTAHEGQQSVFARIVFPFSSDDPEPVDYGLVRSNEKRVPSADPITRS